MKKFMVMLMALCLCGFTSGMVQAEETAPVEAPAKQECQADSVHGNIVDAIKGADKCSCPDKCGCCKCSSKCKCCDKCKCNKCDCPKCKCCDKCKCDCCKKDCDCCKEGCKCGDCPKCGSKCKKDCTCGCKEGKCECKPETADSVHGNIVDAVKAKTEKPKCKCKKGCKCKSEK